MKLKLDDGGNAVLADGKPIYVGEDGKEYPLDGAHLYGKVRELTQEAAGHRKAKEAALDQLRVFEGLDPEAARKAVETVANLDSKKLIDAGEVERVRQSAIQQIKDQYAPIEARAKELEAALHSEKIGNAFSRSKYLADNIGVPLDMVQATFGRSFKIEGDRVVAIDANGNTILSRADFGATPASFEEAISILVESYPHKDGILKSKISPGGGATPSSDVMPGGSTISASKVDDMSPKALAEFYAKNPNVQVVGA
jgi:hypothetical protein